MLKPLPGFWLRWWSAGCARTCFLQTFLLDFSHETFLPSLLYFPRGLVCHGCLAILEDSVDSTAGVHLAGDWCSPLLPLLLWTTQTCTPISTTDQNCPSASLWLVSRPPSITHRYNINTISGSCNAIVFFLHFLHILWCQYTIIVMWHFDYMYIKHWLGQKEVMHMNYHMKT